MTASTETTTRVVDVLVRILGIEERRDSLGPDTELFGSMPELDSLAVLELVTTLEEVFDLTVDDADIDGEVFETVGSLAAFVEQQRA